MKKGINLDTVTDLEIQEIEDRLNNRPQQGECVAEKVPWSKKT
jgi:IS30 family transposase